MPLLKVLCSRSVIYSITSGLLNKQKKVILISLGEIDQKFIELRKGNPNLILLSKDKDSHVINS